MLDLLFAGLVVIVTIDVSTPLVVADVIESCKAGACDPLDTMIGYQKVFFPSHKHHIPVLQIILVCLHVVQTTLELLEQGLEARAKKDERRSEKRRNRDAELIK